MIGRRGEQPMANTKLLALELDFAPVRRNAPAGWVWLGIGLVAATLAGAQFRAAHAERLAHADDLSSLTDRINGRHHSHAGETIDARAAKAASKVARDLEVPWADMLGALEAIQVKDVALLGVEPSSTRHTIRITAEAKSLPPMLDYLEALRGDTFSQVVLTSHQDEPQTPGNPIRFVVQAQWRLGS
jgi:hypothetical protein